MKKYLIIGGFIGMWTGFYSCDYISDPLKPVPPTPDGKTCPDVIFPAAKSHRVVLLEDYTGHTCTACPKAAVEAVKLQNKYKDSLVVVAVHAGHFAYPDPQYPEDFRTEAGNEYVAKFAPGSFPSGLINRVDYGTKPNKDNPQTWGNEIAKQLKIPVEMDLQLACDFNADSNNVCIQIQSKFLSASTPAGNYNLCVMLTQDNIVAPQLDNGVYKPTYVHNHMLRDNINGTWGTELSRGTVTLEPKLQKFKYQIKPNYKGIACKPENCHVIAFVIELDTQKILQAAEAKVIE